MMNPSGDTRTARAIADPEPNHQYTPQEGAMVYVSDHDRWEYRVLSMSSREPQQLERELNELGAHGWELTAVVGQGDGALCYLKRLQD